MERTRSRTDGRTDGASVGCPLHSLHQTAATGAGVFEPSLRPPLPPRHSLPALSRPPLAGPVPLAISWAAACMPVPSWPVPVRFSRDSPALVRHRLCTANCFGTGGIVVKDAGPDMHGRSDRPRLTSVEWHDVTWRCHRGVEQRRRGGGIWRSTVPLARRWQGILAFRTDRPRYVFTAEERIL